MKKINTLLELSKEISLKSETFLKMKPSFSRSIDNLCKKFFFY